MHMIPFTVSYSIVTYRQLCHMQEMSTNEFASQSNLRADSARSFVFARIAIHTQSNDIFQISMTHYLL